MIDIVALERRAMRSWPALHEEAVGGWVMRFAQGYSKRANSLNAIVPDAPLDSAIARAETFYADKGLPTVVRLSPLAPDGADAFLAARGYGLVDPSLVMVARLDTVATDDPVELCRTPDGHWVQAVAAAQNMAPASANAFRAILNRIDSPAVFATSWIDGRAVAHGCAVLEDGAVGLFEIIVSRESRGCGHGRTLVNGLLRWGQEQGAHSGWLQVLQDNEVAISLYRSLGFAEAYRYHYRISAQA